MRDDLSDATLAGQGRAGRRVCREASPTELIYIATCMIVINCGSLSGTIGRALFAAAVAHLETRLGILRSVVEDGHFVGRMGGGSAIEA